MVVFPHEVPVKRAELSAEVAAYERELQENQKQLRYLKHIAEEVRPCFVLVRWWVLERRWECACVVTVIVGFSYLPLRRHSKSTRAAPTTTGPAPHKPPPRPPPPSMMARKAAPCAWRAWAAAP